jgi:cell division protein FtsQ
MRKTHLRMLKAFAMTVLIGGLAAVPVWLWLTGVAGQMAHRATDQALDVTAAVGLRVDDIYVDGRQRTTPDQILGALQIQRGDAILGYDLEAAKRRVEALPWITEAAVERRLPGQILVTITERWPIAIWQNEGHFLLVDPKGTAIGDDVGGVTGLPLVVGEDAPAHASELVGMLGTEPELMRRVKAAVWVSERRWNLVMDRLEGGIAVRLPEENPGLAWKRLAKLEREQRLLERKIVAVDLRLPDRLVVRREAEPAKTPDKDKPRKKGSGKDA